MKRSENYSHLEGIKGKCVISCPEFVVEDVQKSDKDRVLEMVYCPDPVTGLPQSDIGIFLSKDTPDTVRDFIERNIFLESGEKAPVPEGVDEDTIIALTRDRYETREQYVRRINDFMVGEKDKVQSAIKEESMKRSKSK